MPADWRKLRERQGMSRLCVSQYLDCSLAFVVDLEERRLEADEHCIRQLCLLYDLRLVDNSTVAAHGFRQFFKKLKSNVWRGTKYATK